MVVLQLGRWGVRLLLFLAGGSRAAVCPSPRPSPHPMGRGGNILVRRFPGWRSILADGHQSLPRAIIWLPFQGAGLRGVPSAISETGTRPFFGVGLPDANGRGSSRRSGLIFAARQVWRRAVCMTSWCWLFVSVWLRTRVPQPVARHRPRGANHVYAGEQTSLSLSSPAILSRHHAHANYKFAEIVAASLIFCMRDPAHWLIRSDGFTFQIIH